MDKVRVAINGFGRIGRMVFRAIHEREGIEVVAINGLMDGSTAAYLTRYDSTQGRFPGQVEFDGKDLVVDGRRVFLSQEADPRKINWGDTQPEVVVESSGVFRRKSAPDGGYGDHLRGSVKKVVLTAPAKDSIDRMVVLGVNDEVIRPEDQFVSNASCTTNCLAPMVKVLHQHLGVERGFMTTVHSYTNDQRILDRVHEDLRRSRAAAVSQIPTTTGAAKAMGIIMPELKGLLDGISIRVPTPTGSSVDFVCNVKKTATIEVINAMMKEEAQKEAMKDIFSYTEDPIVSADIIHDMHSTIFDAMSTKVIGNMVKVLGWYDNEWGYSCRVADLCKKVVLMSR